MSTPQRVPPPFSTQALLVVDVQPSFSVPDHIVAEITALSRRLYTVATVERHDEAVTPFERQLGWKPEADDESLVLADRVFVKHGYLPPMAVIEHLKSRGVERVFVGAVAGVVENLGGVVSGLFNEP